LILLFIGEASVFDVFYSFFWFFVFCGVILGSIIFRIWVSRRWKVFWKKDK
jgi:hypothetical protein